MKIILGADAGGFLLKEAVMAHLLANGHEVQDCGTITADKPAPFYEIAPVVAKSMQENRAQRGLLFCGTGMGMSILANRFEGVYAAVVESVFAARYCRLVNNCNVLCLGGHIWGHPMAIQAVDVFLKTEFTEGFPPERQQRLATEVSGFQEKERALFADNFLNKNGELQ